MNTMEKSIIRTVCAYASIQLVIMTLFRITASETRESLFSYAVASVLLHAALIIFLIAFKSTFYNLSTDAPLTRINAANRITLLRISSLPTVAFLLRNRDITVIKTVLPVVLVAVFLTDTFDGQIARRGKQITKMGQMLDSISDYSLLPVISLVSLRSGIVPAWFFLLIFARLLFQAVGTLVFIVMRKPIETKSTIGGKMAIATTMALYVAELVRLFLPPACDPAFKALELISGAIVFASCFEKAYIFINHARAPSRARNA